MNKRLLSVLAFALVISAVASWVLYRLIVTKLSTSAKPAIAQVVVASRNLEIGTLLKDADVKVVDWNGPEPKGALGASSEVVGRGVVATIYEGEPILETRLAAKGAGGGLAATIPPGMRAVSIRVNDVAGVSGFVRPGARVDVLIAGTPPGGSNGLGTVTKTLLQNMEVLSAGQDMQKDAEGKPVSVPVVNLLVTPEQAETLSLASNTLKIQLVLRNPLDTQMAKVPPEAMSNIFLGTAPVPAAAAPRRAAGGGHKPAPKTYSVIISNGSKTTEEKFATPEGQH